jgi:hypothetical protein
LQLLSAGDLVWVKIPKLGFVGVGRATGSAQPAKSFLVQTPQGQVPVLEAAKRGTYHREFVDDPERCEYFVPIEWAQTVPIEQAVQEVGFFGNQKYRMQTHDSQVAQHCRALEADFRAI